MANDFRLTLRFLVYREGDWWFAHCLELDVVAEGKSAHEAFADVLGLCAAQFQYALEQGNVDAIFRPAPADCWRMYALAKDFDPLPGQLPAPIEKVEVRELAPV